MQRPHGDRSPLILIVVLVYAAFLVTAVASIMVFFPQLTLPGTLRLPSLQTAARAPAAPAAPPAAPAPAPAARSAAPPAPAPAARSAAPPAATPGAPPPLLARAFAEGSEWMGELQWPDVGAWASRAWTSVSRAISGLRWPDFGALIGHRAPTAAAPPSARAAVPSAAAPAPAPGASPAPRATELENAAGALERASSDLQAAAHGLSRLLGGAGAAAAPGPATQPSDVEALRRGYEARLQEQEQKRAAEIAALRERLAAAGSAGAEQAARRYNPVFDQPAIAALLKGGVDRSLFGAQVTAAYSDVLQREGVASREQYDLLRQRAAELDTLTGKLLEVPYTNSVPPALERIRDAGQTLAREYGRIWTALADRLRGRDERIGALQAEINQFSLAMEQLSRDSREGGYILDPRDPQSILLYISRLQAPRVGDTVYVFRSETELLATLRITAVGDTVRASLVEQRSPGKPIVAFDRILLAASEEKRG